MIRKTSYFVNIPANIKAFMPAEEPVLLVLGPLGRAAVSFGAEHTPRIERGRISWSRIVGYSRRSELRNKAHNNGIRRLLRNLFYNLATPSTASLRLVGRGYRVSWSPCARKLFLSLGFSGKKGIPLPAWANLRVSNRYNFDLVSLDAPGLRVLSLDIRALRPPNGYTAKGTILNDERVSVKPGKKSQY
uniref:Ribosomal protein L6 n=1 Tax=Lotharella oceanica TaxID=641309 RepID=A0A140GYQ2_9EUKA|nr:ribosomal protein L6 [Lotharella oceanica]AMN87074.1 ribosomal protein L6 [Lotharella oceanica]